MMSKIGNISEGWKNHLSGDKASLDVAKERMEHCIDCPSRKYDVITSIIGGELKETVGYKCAECGCPLATKLRSTKDKCPLNKW